MTKVSEMPVQYGDTVLIEYELTDENGNLLDSSEKGEDGAIKIQLGTHQVIRGLEESIVGMEVGDQRKVTLPPEQSFGEFDPLLLEKIPKNQLEDGETLKVGDQVEVVGPNGMGSPGWVRLVEDDYIIVDLNHPYAGKTVSFDIKLLESGLEPDPQPNPFQMDACAGNCDHDHASEE